MSNRLKLTKDEARILFHAIEEMKYQFNERLDFSNMRVFMALEEKLYNFSLDRRRRGRRSKNDFIDVLRRFSNK